MKNIGKIINTKAETILESCRKTLIFSSILFVLLIIQGVLFVAVEERYPILTFFYVFSLFVFLFILSVLISGATAQLYSEKKSEQRKKVKILIKLMKLTN